MSIPSELLSGPPTMMCVGCSRFSHPYDPDNPLVWFAAHMIQGFCGDIRADLGGGASVKLDREMHLTVQSVITSKELPHVLKKLWEWYNTDRTTPKPTGGASYADSMEAVMKKLKLTFPKVTAELLRGGARAELLCGDALDSYLSTGTDLFLKDPFQMRPPVPFSEVMWDPKSEKSPYWLDSLTGEEVSVPVTVPPIRRHVLEDLDEWDKARGEEVRKLTKADPLLAGWPDHHFTDCHAAAFLREPRVTEEPVTNPLFRQYLQTLLETPAYQALHQGTQLNPLASELAAVEFMRGYHKAVQEDRKNQASGPEEGEVGERHMALLRQAAKAAAKATEVVEEAEEVARSLGGNGADPGRVDTTLLKKCLKRTKKNPWLKKICELTGRFRRFAQSRQRQKTVHGLDDTVGVVPGDDVSRLLPHELALLNDPVLGPDAMRRLVEGESQSWEYRGVEQVGKGPIVVCVDESGSMFGEPVVHAKAFALAMAWVANHQRRQCKLVGFSGGTTGHGVTIPPDRWPAVQVMEWAEHFYGGGTDCDVPLVELPEHHWGDAAPGKTDLIFITDARAVFPPSVKQSFLAWKERNNVRVITLVLNADPGPMPEVSDQTYKIPNIETDVEAVQQCLSL